VTVSALKALSIRQPWAWLIVSGHKDIENRGWNTNFRGRILVHAGLRYAIPKDCWPWKDIPHPGSFDVGGIVGSVEIADVVTQSRSRWFEGPFGFVLRDPRRGRFVPCPGRLMFFTPDIPQSSAGGAAR
jgi:hypothetical protein